MFEINTKVICVDDRFPKDSIFMTNYRELPKKNRIYTVRDVIPGQSLDLKPAVTILLKEINNPIQPHINQEPGFAHWRFVEPEELAEHEARVEKAPKPKEKSKPAPATPIKKPELVPAFL
jgi:hypothetical protein